MHQNLLIVYQKSLAEQGVLFRKAFCGAPTCSPSRASLLTGQYAHCSGMLGLMHRGFSLNDYTQHLLYTLRKEGYHSPLIGEEHLSKDRNVRRGSLFKQYALAYGKIVEIIDLL